MVSHVLNQAMDQTSYQSQNQWGHKSRITHSQYSALRLK